jgi:HK97 family phage prohead protease
MNDRFLACPIELKFLDGGSAGSFEGYASVFGVLDSHRDVVAPGAFKNTLAQMKVRGFNVPLYLNHGARGGADGLPSGIWSSIEEDSKGLAVKGQMLGLETDIGRYRHDLVKGGALRGISIGYRVPPGGATYGKTALDPRRTLKTIELGEISLVDNPSNHMSSVTAIKSCSDMTEREFEQLLMRDAGLTASEAKTIISSGFKSLKATRDAGDEKTVADSLGRLLHIIRS